MSRKNLSALRNYYVLVSDSPNGLEYWCGGSHWVDDVDHPEVNKLSARSTTYWLERLTAMGVNAMAKQVDHHYSLMYWVDIGWVVITTVNNTTSAHRVHFVNTTGQGWYMKDEGSTTRKLCMNLSLGVYGELMVHGQRIGEYNVITEGVSTRMTAFTIPTNSNLVYQFEYDVEPVESI